MTSYIKYVEKTTPGPPQTFFIALILVNFVELYSPKFELNALTANEISYSCQKVIQVPKSLFQQIGIFYVERHFKCCNYV